MNKKIKIVATAVIAASVLTSCSDDVVVPPNAGMPVIPQMGEIGILPEPASVEPKQSDSNDFVSVDPVSPENSGEKVTE